MSTPTGNPGRRTPGSARPSGSGCARSRLRSPRPAARSCPPAARRLRRRPIDPRRSQSPARPTPAPAGTASRWRPDRSSPGRRRPPGACPTARPSTPSATRPGGDATRSMPTASPWISAAAAREPWASSAESPARRRAVVSSSARARRRSTTAGSSASAPAPSTCRPSCSPTSRRRRPSPTSRSGGPRAGSTRSTPTASSSTRTPSDASTCATSPPVRLSSPSGSSAVAARSPSPPSTPRPPSSGARRRWIRPPHRTVEQVVAGAPSGSGTRTLMLLNPGTSTARVGVQVIGGEGHVRARGARVGQGRRRTVHGGRPCRSRWAPTQRRLRLKSDQPVSASMRVAPTPRTDAVVEALPALDGPAVVPVDLGTGTRAPRARPHRTGSPGLRCTSRRTTSRCVARPRPTSRSRPAPPRVSTWPRPRCSTRRAWPTWWCGPRAPSSVRPPTAEAAASPRSGSPGLRSRCSDPRSARSGS